MSHFVRPKTALDREALERGTSVYLPDRVLPMLPEVISNGLASLQPGKVRYTKSAVMEFTDEGLRVSTELHSAAIRSSKRLTYEQVDEFLVASSTKPRPPVAAAQAGQQGLGPAGRMHTLAMTLRRRRLAHGALELNMPEVKVELDKQGRVAGAHVAENTESHQIIEEFMLAANEAVAETLRDRGLHFLRRIHQSPSPQKLDALTAFIDRTGLQDRRVCKAASSCKSSWPLRRDGRSSTPCISPCCARCNGQSIAPRRKATTPWPAIATATSPRPFAAIPT